MVLVVQFRRHADTSRDELQALLRVSSQVNVLSALEWQAIAEGEVSSELWGSIDEARAAADSELARIAEDDAGGAESALMLTFRAYAAAIQEEVSLVEAGWVEEARDLDEEQVARLLYGELRTAIDEQVTGHEEEARASARTSDIGMVLIVALGAFISGVLLWSQEAMRRRAQLAVAAQEKAEALQESEQRFRAMVENLTEIVFVVDRDGRITYISPALRGICGYDPEEVVGRPFSELVHQEDTLKVTDNLARTLDGGSEPLEFRAVTAGGEVRWVRSSSGPIFENGEPAGVRGVLMDISDLKAAQEELQSTNSALEAIVEASPLAIIAIKPDKSVAMWNPAAEQLFGWSPEETLGKPYPLVTRSSESEFAVLLEKVLAGGEVTGFETQRLKKNGELIDVSIFAAPLRSGDNEITGALGVIADITARKRAEETIRHLAYHDPLTGLPNRALLTDRLEVSMAQARRSGEPLAVLYLDLDNFKVINDSVGHNGGDVLLRIVADRLRGLVRETDTIARVGGDEFTILLVSPCGQQEAADIGERIRAELNERWHFDDHEFSVSASIGVALYPSDGPDSGTLLKNADRAMYVAKNEGRNRIRMFRESMNESSEYRLSMERDLRRALREKQLVLHYQPQVDLATGAIVGVEALVRWDHPERGFLLPGQFLPLAEETGLILEIDEWVLETAARQLVEWHASGYRMTMAVNLSAFHFESRGFIRKMSRLLSKTGVDPASFLIEITETVAMRETNRTVRVLSALKRMGLSLAIDDFGTGHSSLTYLRRFPVDAIKIDRSFVDGIGRNGADEALVAAIVAMAHSLNLNVIAEGVETQVQLEFLKNLPVSGVSSHPRGCDYFQGFLASRAVSADAIEALLAREGEPVAG